MIKVGPTFEKSIRIDESPKSLDLDISLGKKIMKLGFKDKRIECTNPCDEQNRCVIKWGKRTLKGSLRENYTSTFEKWLGIDKNLNLSIIENYKDIQIKLLTDGDHLTADIVNIADLNDKCQFNEKPRRCLQRRQSSNELKDRILLTL